MKRRGNSGAAVPDGPAGVCGGAAMRLTERFDRFRLSGRFAGAAVAGLLLALLTEVLRGAAGPLWLYRIVTIVQCTVLLGLWLLPWIAAGNLITLARRGPEMPERKAILLRSLLVLLAAFAVMVAAGSAAGYFRIPAWLLRTVREAFSAEPFRR